MWLIKNNSKTQKAIFASGCFWGTQHYFDLTPGVIATTVGYSGGDVNNPTYREVSSGKTGHAESVEVVFDPKIISYKNLVKLFFETHDFSQIGRQGPDIGSQYRSAIFYSNISQKKVAAEIIKELKNKGYLVATELKKVKRFWPAEDYHQKYYKKSGGSPYCHIYRKLF